MSAIELQESEGRSMPKARILEAVTKRGVYIALAATCLLAAMVSPAFYQPTNLFNVLRQSSALGILSVGQTIVMIGGGIDISVAATMQLATIMAAEITQGENTLVIPAIVVCLSLGALVGLLNGLIIAKRRVPPFVVTLGMSMIITGARMVYTKATPSGTLPTLLRILGQHRIGPVPVAALIFAAVAALAAVVLHRTTFGRRLYATGGNARASRLCGVNTDRIIVLTYVISGLLAGLAGLVLAGYVGYADQWMGRGLELDSIAATVVGGTSFAGGVGGVSGTVAGVLLVSVLSNVLLLLNVNVQLQLVMKGLVIIAAVAAYSYQTRD